MPLKNKRFASSFAAKDDRRADGPVRQNHADMVNNVAGGVDKMDPETGAGGKGDMKKMGNPKGKLQTHRDIEVNLTFLDIYWMSNCR